LEDLFFGLMGLLVCVTPFVLLGGLVIFLTTRKDPVAGKRDELEWELNTLKAQHETLSARVIALEARVAHAETLPRVMVAGPVVLEAAAPAIEAIETTAPRDTLTEPAHPIDPREVPAVVIATPLAAAYVASDADAAPSVQATASVAAAALATTAAAASDAAPASAAIAASIAATDAASIAATDAAAASVAASDPAAAPAATASGAAPPATPTGTAPPAPPPPSDEGGGFEQLIGVKGAAVLGALVLVVAGLYFFKYSIDHGLIGPELRLAMGFAVGLGCVVLSERPLRTLAPALSPWLAGAGIAILYSASWASSAIYDLVPVAVAGLLMAVVTAAATLLAVRRESLPIAVLGLLGGFITPLALSSGEDHPIPLFAYLLVLDGALLYVAHRRRWPSLGLLALIATAAYQFGWLGGRMSDATALIGVAVVAIFSLLFAFVPLPTAETSEGRALPLATRVGATLLPFLMALTFLGRTALFGWPTVSIVIAASIGALVVTRRESMAWLGVAAATGASGVLLVSSVSWWQTDGALGPIATLFLALPVVFHLGAELQRMERTALRAAGTVVLSVLGTAMVCVASSGSHPHLFLGACALALALGLRQASVTQRQLFPYALALCVAVAAFLGESSHSGLDVWPSTSFWLAVEVAPIVLFTLAALLARRETKPGLDIAALVQGTAALALMATRAGETGHPEALSLALAVGLVFVLTMSATQRHAPVGLGMLVLVVGAFTATLFSQVTPRGGDLDPRMALLFGMVLFTTAWPFLARRVGATNWGWRTAAMAGPLFFIALRSVWVEVLGDAMIGALPVILGALVLIAAIGARRTTSEDPATQRTATVWLAAVAAGFVTLAIPLQLSNEWITIGWALEAAALLALDARLRHTGLRYLALALFTFVLLRLSPIPYLLEYHPRGAWRIVNWLSYTYLVPAAAFLGGSFLLSRYEVEARTELEKTVFGPLAQQRLYAGYLFAGVIGLVFVWLNLSIIDFFATGPYLVIPTDLVPARGLAISTAWAAYALVLLGLGMWRSNTALRTVSLLLMLATCGKVFLHDLSNLGDLYRVAALVFLAFSLIAVSFFYQRFVFKRRGT
jgi:hypothetical protein